MTTKLMLAHNYTDQDVIGWHMSEILMELFLLGRVQILFKNW